MTASDFVTLDLVYHSETSGERAAVQLSHARDGDHPRKEWVPKSLCQKVAEGKWKLPRWKAEQIGFLVTKDDNQGRLL